MGRRANCSPTTHQEWRSCCGTLVVATPALNWSQLDAPPSTPSNASPSHPHRYDAQSSIRPLSYIPRRGPLSLFCTTLSPAPCPGECDPTSSWSGVHLSASADCNPTLPLLFLTGTGGPNRLRAANWCWPAIPGPRRP